MLVFSKARLVFLSVPKTGTTAWQAALEAHASMIVRAPPELKHAPVFRYNRFFRPMLEKFICDDLAVLAVMRDPIDWLGSWYRYRRRPSLEGHATGTHGVSFDAFLRGYATGDRPAFADVGSQAKFLEPQRNGTRATHVFRYEDQAGLRCFLEKRLGVRIETEQMNVSPAMDLALSAQTEQILRRKCPADFALYDSIGAGGAYTAQAAD